MQKIIPIIICTIIGAICYRYSKQRGRNPYTWFAIGLLFGVFGLIALFVMPPLNRPRGAKKGKGPAIEPLPTIFKNNLETLDPSHTSKLWYYLDQENQQFGPMSLDALTNAWRDGKVHATTYVWNEVMENWKRFEEVLKAPLQPT
ncbi:MAG: DUF4339 domain-containing protein [Verrucomicrobia bacterium]|nr:DUF4339 domain-containing protein [Verrucomicrobiota bacterium]